MEVKTLKESIPLLTRSLFFPDVIFEADKMVFAEHRLLIIQQVVESHMKVLTLQDIQCIVHLYSIFLSNRNTNSRSINQVFPQYFSFIQIMKQYKDAYKDQICTDCDFASS